MSSLLFWDVTQRGFIVIDVSVQPIGPLKIGPMSGLYDRGDRCVLLARARTLSHLQMQPASCTVVIGGSLPYI
jgi:hypothetical protein